MFSMFSLMMVVYSRNILLFHVYGKVLRPSFLIFVYLIHNGDILYKKIILSTFNKLYRVWQK